ncbi:MAG: EAL domain-containing protein [Gammaproteobacteria bacterium]
MKILLIEDNVTDADFLRAALRRSKAEEVDLTHASTLKEGGIELRKGDFDVVLLDMGLPDGNGMECVVAVQAANPEIPIIVLSGQDDEEFAVSILNQGVQDYLVKWEGKGRVILRAIRYAMERKKAELRLNYLAQYDKLTGIPNRDFLSGHLKSALARAQRGDNKVGLFHIDLKDFKSTNDTIGNEAGDKLLKAIAERFQLHTRAGDTLARIGGDDFAVVVEGLNEANDAESIARNLISSLTEPFDIDGTDVSIGGTIGITVFPDDSEEIDVLLKNAEIAMYKAKESGEQDFMFFTGDMQSQIKEQYQLAEDIQSALRLKQFALVYQPKIDIQTQQLKGVEALIRWNCPTRGLVNPGDFLNTAEETGYIVPLGYWIIGDVCRAIQKWDDDGLKIVPVSINISRRQFQQSDFPEKVAEILDSYGINPDLIELELTEELLFENVEKVAQTMAKLKEIGLKLSIDDFGTGKFSISYLQKFPIDTLKIDASFIEGVTEDPDCDYISRAIISLAKSLKLECVAEGVETERQLEFLKDSSCDVVQGYLFGHPIWGKEIVELLEASKGNFSQIKPAVSFTSSETKNVRILNQGAKYLT